MRVPMLKKTNANVKKHIVLSVEISLFFREKRPGKHAKSMKTSFVHRNRQQITSGTALYSKKSIFHRFSRAPRVLRGFSGRAGKYTKLVVFLIYGH